MSQRVGSRQVGGEKEEKIFGEAGQSKRWSREEGMEWRNIWEVKLPNLGGQMGFNR